MIIDLNSTESLIILYNLRCRIKDLEELSQELKDDLIIVADIKENIKEVQELLIKLR
ncbi:hypothetical protein H7E67_01920 [Clostridium gasigenes]|uniref:hypothetical protein n=1 Tax=Clostridium gasigenes TaxID=94869 RepID=UPI00162559BD|nr:hypothetical protein [Clostridium gasigenes]MBB6622177.1 hypothetical protein [Clostridium gasigenes]